MSEGLMKNEWYGEGQAVPSLHICQLTVRLLYLKFFKFISISFLEYFLGFQKDLVDNSTRNMYLSEEGCFT